MCQRYDITYGTIMQRPSDGRHPANDQIFSLYSPRRRKRFDYSVQTAEAGLPAKYQGYILLDLLSLAFPRAPLWIRYLRDVDYLQDSWHPYCPVIDLDSVLSSLLSGKVTESVLQCCSFGIRGPS